MYKEPKSLSSAFASWGLILEGKKSIVMARDNFSLYSAWTVPWITHDVCHNRRVTFSFMWKSCNELHLPGNKTMSKITVAYVCSGPKHSGMVVCFRRMRDVSFSKVGFIHWEKMYSFRICSLCNYIFSQSYTLISHSCYFEIKSKVPVERNPEVNRG